MRTHSECAHFFPKQKLSIFRNLFRLGVYTGEYLGEYLDAYLDSYKSQVYEQYRAVRVNRFAVVELPTYF